ncbi:DUF374 domain-containing protein [Myxococcota bacterium]|nr:DUF374 domain-containing protein [Myxococcota bacterium]
MSLGTTLLRAVVRVWLHSLRVRRVGPAFARPAVLVFWHGDQFPLLAVRPQPPVAAPVSLSRDGTLHAGLLEGLGITCIRGSTSRGGARAARGLVRALLVGSPVLVAVDGPRGPRGTVAPGAAFLARRTGAPVQAVGVAVARGHRLRRAWDRFLLPCPLTKTIVVVSEPLAAANDETLEAFGLRIGEALRRVSTEAIGRIRGQATASAPDHEEGVS